MPGDDLSSIQVLEDEHLRALAQQDDARSTLGETGPDTPEWQMAASFVVVFSQRRAGEVWEHRVEAERTEVEPERNPQVWPAWECEPVCRWMLGQLGQADSAGPASVSGTADAATQPAGEQAAAAEPPPAEPPPAGPVAQRPALRIDRATIIDPTGRVDMLTDGALVERPRTELVAPVRLVFTVSGASPQTPLQAVTRILRRYGPGWNAHYPVVVPGSGQAEFDLSRVPAGEHEMSLIAWAPDAAAKPVSVRLPKVTIRSADNGT